MATQSSRLLGQNVRRTGGGPVMYAISVDLDTKDLQQSYPSSSWQNADADNGKFLCEKGFDHLQGSVYFGDDPIDVVRRQLTVQEMTIEFDWFAPSVRDIRMLRIEDYTDLRPAIDLALAMKSRRAGRSRSCPPRRTTECSAVDQSSPQRHLRSRC